MKVQKDIKDVLGIFKKRFKCFKVFTRFVDQIVIRNQFFFCCIIYNLCSEYEEYLSHDHVLDIDHSTDPEGLEVRYQNGYVTGVGFGADKNVTVFDENGWMDRIIASTKHVEIQSSILQCT